MISRYVASLFILTSCRSGFGWSSLCSGGPMVGGWPCLLGHKVRVRCTRLIVGPARSSKHFASCSIGVQHAAWWWEANDTCSGASPISLYVLTGTWSVLCCDSLWLASGIDPVWHLVDWRTRPAYQRLINVSMLWRCAVYIIVWTARENGVLTWTCISLWGACQGQPLSRLGHLDEVTYHAPLTWVGSSVGFILWMSWS